MARISIPLVNPANFKGIMYSGVGAKVRKRVCQLPYNPFVQQWRFQRFWLAYPSIFPGITPLTHVQLIAEGSSKLASVPSGGGGGGGAAAPTASGGAAPAAAAVEEKEEEKEVRTHHTHNQEPDTD